MVHEEHVRFINAVRNSLPVGQSQEFSGAIPLMLTAMALNFFGSFLVSEDKTERVGSIFGVGSSGVMIGMAVLQFQNTGTDYSTQATIDFLNIYFPSMFLIFGFFQFLYCFLIILKSCKRFCTDDK